MLEENFSRKKLRGLRNERLQIHFIDHSVGTRQRFIGDICDVGQQFFDLQRNSENAGTFKESKSLVLCHSYSTNPKCLLRRNITTAAVRLYCCRRFAVQCGHAESTTQVEFILL